MPERPTVLALFVALEVGEIDVGPQRSGGRRQRNAGRAPHVLGPHDLRLAILLRQLPELLERLRHSVGAEVGIPAEFFSARGNVRESVPYRVAGLEKRLDTLEASA